ncbi:MAG: hypothetical protein ACJLS2_04870 [Microcella pacifica]
MRRPREQGECRDAGDLRDGDSPSRSQARGLEGEAGEEHAEQDGWLQVEEARQERGEERDDEDARQQSRACGGAQHVPGDPRRHDHGEEVEQHEPEPDGAHEPDVPHFCGDATGERRDESGPREGGDDDEEGGEEGSLDVLARVLLIGLVVLTIAAGESPG